MHKFLTNFQNDLFYCSKYIFDNHLRGSMYSPAIHLYNQQFYMMQQAYLSQSSAIYNHFKNPRKWEYTQYGKNLSQIKSFLNDYTEITILSYNVLAQYLIESNMYLYTPCDPRFLQWDYRKQNLLAEIKQMKADILCLQEIQADHYVNFFYPELSKLGYEGVYKKRTRTKLDGCATFFQKHLFELEYAKAVEYLRPQNVCQILDRDNVALILVLKIRNSLPTPVTFDTVNDSKKTANNQSNKKFQHSNNTPKNSSAELAQDATKFVADDAHMRFCVANTHLLFNPKRDDIKLVQSHILMAEIDRLASQKHLDNNSKNNNGNHHNEKSKYYKTRPKLPVILCGDFNLTPNNAIYRQFFNPRESKIYENDAIFNISNGAFSEFNNEDVSIINTFNIPPPLPDRNLSNSRVLSHWDAENIMKNLRTDQFSCYVNQMVKRLSPRNSQSSDHNNDDEYCDGNDSRNLKNCPSNPLSHRFPFYSVYGHYTPLQSNSNDSSCTKPSNDNATSPLKRCNSNTKNSKTPNNNALSNPIYVPEITTKNAMSGFTVDYIFYTSNCDEIDTYPITPIPTTSNIPLNSKKARTLPNDTIHGPNNSKNADNTAKINAKPSNKNENDTTKPYKMSANLKLIARYNLLSETDVINKLGGCLPSQHISSDHLCLAAKFILHK